LQQQLDQIRAQLSVLTTSVSSIKELRGCVKRDLDWLLNASQYAPQEDLDDYPEVACSVLNYGMPDLTGKTVSGFDQRHMERLLKQVIVSFEPRIIRNTLTVRVIADKSLFDHNALAFEIEGELWAEPQPLHLLLRTEFELEDGNVSVYDFYPRE
jgi:type VI secretion system lysozyme-like protein